MAGAGAAVCPGKAGVGGLARGSTSGAAAANNRVLIVAKVITSARTCFCINIFSCEHSV
jgi:hypothetical protein